MTRIGVLGLGKVAQLHHLPALASHPDMVVTAVCDWSAELTSKIARQYRVPTPARNLDEILEAGVDVVFISNRDHLKPVLGALQAGRTIFVEKPLAWSREEAEEIRDAVVRSKGRLMVGYMKLADPAVAALATWVAAEHPDLVRVTNRAGGRHKLERIYPHLKATYRADEADRGQELRRVDEAVKKDLHTEDSRATSAYFTLLELATHDLSLLRRLWGDDVDVDYSRAITRSSTTVYDIGMLIGGVPVRMECVPSFDSLRGWDESLSAYSTDSSATLEFPSPFLREGATRLHTRRADVAGERECTTTFTHQSPYRLQLDHLHRLAHHDVAPPCDAEGGARDVDLVSRIVRQMDFR